jgi:hypothetical protein
MWPARNFLTLEIGGYELTEKSNLKRNAMTPLRQRSRTCRWLALAHNPQRSYTRYFEKFDSTSPEHRHVKAKRRYELQPLHERRLGSTDSFSSAMSLRYLTTLEIPTDEGCAKALTAFGALSFSAHSTEISFCSRCCLGA